MRTSLFSIFVFAGIFCHSCETKQAPIIQIKDREEKHSRVVNFNYGGYGDYIYAVLYGNIYVNDTAGNSIAVLKPLQNAVVKIEAINKFILTDPTGEFDLELEKGIFSLLVTKDGYQSLRLKNYISDPDQISVIKIILEKGNGLQTFVIPERKQL